MTKGRLRGFGTDKGGGGQNGWVGEERETSLSPFCQPLKCDLCCCSPPGSMSGGGGFQSPLVGVLRMDPVTLLYMAS